MSADRTRRDRPPTRHQSTGHRPGAGPGPAPRPPAPLAAPGLDRRRFLVWASALGLGASALPRVVWGEAAAAAAGRPITAELLAAAESLTAEELTPAERDLMIAGLADLRQAYLAIRAVELPNDVPPAFHFDPRPPGRSHDARRSGPPPLERPAAAVVRPGSFRTPEQVEELAFAPVTELSALLRVGRVRSVDLTRMYLDRLRRYDPHLHCVVNLTEERAMEQAARADAELAAGRWRGPLHGVPWGAKDLLAVAGYPTTWGAEPYRDQVLDTTASVVRRLDDAGAVLVAKLTLGALAWGDVWFGGTTRNPWDLGQGSSGSSAGPAAAVAAGLVGFTIGTETWGSIVSPSTRVGASGLRPTFGRVSRSGAMALSWTMDKIGPICRSVADCALVFAAIQGPDGEDPTVIEAPFEWEPGIDLRRLRVGYVKSLFEAAPEEGEEEWHRFDLAALDTLRGLGLDLVPIELPAGLPVDALSFILTAEAAAAFDELTRSGRDDLLVRQIADAWPNVFRQGRTIPAVEYVQANRVRTLLMREMARLVEPLDAYVVPSFGGSNLLLTNLTGHPAVVVPDGFRADGTPTSITFQGKLFGESSLLALARAYQEATDHHLRHPDLDQEVRDHAAAGGDAAGPVDDTD